MKLLLIGCSQRKNPAPGLLPAMQRYTGGTYQVLQRAQREGYWPTDCQLLIVSALYGLLFADTPIAFYDCKMSRKQAVALQPTIGWALDMVLVSASYAVVFQNLGPFYRLAVQGSRELARLQQDGRVWEAFGGMGYRLQQTKCWLKDGVCPVRVPARA